MEPLSDQWEVEFERPHGRHGWAAVVALAISLVLHAVAIRQMPMLPVGQPTGMAREERLPPVVLGEVSRAAQERLDRPDRFRAEDPSVAQRAELMPSAFKEIIETLAPPEPLEMGVELAGEHEALASPAVEEDRARWDPRQDIALIRNTIVPDEVAALPRRYLPDIERVRGAPDIALPTESPADSLMARGEARMWAPAAASESLGDARFVEEKPTPETVDALERPDLLAEEPAEVSDLAPIEQLLALDLATHVDERDPDYLYFQIGIRRAGVESLPVLAKDVLLIQDASASITQRMLNEAKLGLHQWLDHLNPEDRLELIAFRDDVEHCFGELTPVTAAAQARGAFFIEAMRAKGGTDVFRSLEVVTEMANKTERPLIAILISDGVPTTGVVDSSDIIYRFSEANQGRVSVFSVGAGPRVNKYLLDFLSYKNRGDAKMMDSRDDIDSALGLLAQELSRPVLTDLRFRLSGDKGAELYPQSLSHLYLDRPLVIHGRVPRATPDMAIQLVGRSGHELKDMLFVLKLDEGHVGDEEIRTAWAWQKIYYLVGEHIQTGRASVMAEIRSVAAAFGLRVLYGSEYVPRHF